ncbi:ribonuclease H2 subunit B-like isoform X2 [Xyrauchen texanus]|nr:ribonuclease H2 subunit B-like isoform X2 [Xyrauchen texanus]XP_051998420.1 ribonuclease H2 subunit B-like isoform X2 [Xyrauchen texanus]
MWKPGTIHHSFQEDAFSCGVFVMQMAKQVVEHFPNIPESINIIPSKEEMCHIRKNVAKTILQASVSRDEYCSVCGQKDTKKKKGQKDQTEELCTWVQCELCQRWFHVQCLEINLPPKEEPWICGILRDCTASPVWKLEELNTQRWDSVLVTGSSADSDPTFTKLKNPATESSSLYLFGCGDISIYEVKAFNEAFRSWFIGQTVQRDGRLLYVTPIDCLFLLLPYITSAATEGKFQPVKQMVMDEDFPGCTRLLQCKQGMDALQHVADEKEVGGLKFHRYNQEKTMEWLKKKVQRTVSTLKKSNISVGVGVKSSTFVRVKQEADATEEDYLRYAHGLISEYISENLSKDLLKHLQLAEISSPKETEPPSKKRKLSDKPVEAGEDYTKFNSAEFARKATKMTAAQKTLAKVDKTGMKSISAFFSPKIKQEKN